jgi:hypothetical protein
VRFASVTVLGGAGGRVAMLAKRQDLFSSSPALVAQFLTVCEEMERMMAEAIADRIGVDVQANPYPRLQAGVVVLVLKTAMEFWHARPDLIDLPTLAGQAIDFIRAGLPEPPGDCAPGDGMPTWAGLPPG